MFRWSIQYRIQVTRKRELLVLAISSMSRQITRGRARNSARILAVDWSGRRGSGQKDAIWLGEAADGKLVRLESGRTRRELVDWLIAEAAADPNLVVGMDFAFSLPAWYLRDIGLAAQQLWAVLTNESLTPRMKYLGLARWMNAPEPPFWVTSEAHALLASDQEFRKTDHEARAAGAQAKSVFQLVGAGQVGRGSLYGMAALHRLAAAGFRVWPFGQRGMPTVVEMYPRLLTGRVTKSSQRERERYLSFLPMPPALRDLAAAGEDAFDAAVSALVMAAAASELAALPDEPDFALEGKIWQPRERVL